MKNSKERKQEFLLDLNRDLNPGDTVLAVNRGGHFYDFYVQGKWSWPSLHRVTNSLAIALDFRYNEKREAIAVDDPNDVVHRAAYHLYREPDGSFCNESANALSLERI